MTSIERDANVRITLGSSRSFYAKGAGPPQAFR